MLNHKPIVGSLMHISSHPGAKFYDTLVVGAGVIGSSTAHSLAKADNHVLVVEKQPSGELTKGSSIGKSRICRQVAIENPEYSQINALNP